MRLDDEEISKDYEIQSPGGGGGFGLPRLSGGIPFGRGGLGCGGLILLVVLSLALGLDPVALISGVTGSMSSQSQDSSQQPGIGQQGAQQAGQQDADGRTLDANGQVSDDQLTDAEKYTLRVLGLTRTVWTQLFAARGQTYQPTKISFYTNQGQSGCGAAQSAMGPFYCPSDHKIYIDTSFYTELSQQLNAPGDFPIAYVVAHEVGHHVQTLTGIADQVRRQQARQNEAGANALQVRMELQADCYAGVWAANERRLMEPGDMEEGLRAAQAIGDDTLQRAARGVVVPESFTHGSSDQRMRWLQRGLTSGDPEQCDTFSARTL